MFFFLPSIKNGLRSSKIISGFTLIETLVSSAILLILLSAVTVIVSQTLENIIQARIRTLAVAVAQSEIEIMQNLPYADVGVVGGIPSGPVEPQKQIDISGQVFDIETSVIYIDDPYDGIGSDDDINTDYKRIRVQISWSGSYPSRAPVVILANLAPKGKESEIPSGILIIRVYDSNGETVPGAVVTIDNDDVNPPIHLQTYTDSNGEAILPGAPPCSNCYMIAVTKNGYSSDRTYTQAEVAHPVKPPASVVVGEVTPITLAIDRTGVLTLKSYNILYAPKSFVRFDLRGSKIIGYDTDDNPVYKYTYTGDTGTYIRTIFNLEWDIYDISLSSYGNTYAGSNPTMPVILAPNMNLTVPFIAGPQTNTSLLLAVKNLAGILQASASATLKNDALGYELTKTTPATGAADMGQVFFYNLTPETYNWQINLNGFQEATGSVYIDSNIRQAVILEEL